MGGAFLSRLNAVLREDKGYTYGVRMAFSPLQQGGSFAVQGSFRTEVVADALQITRDLIDVGPSPFTAQEVDEAVAFYTGVSPLRYATADGVADQAANQALMGLPDDYVDRSLALLRSVTPESARRRVHVAGPAGRAQPRRGRRRRAPGRTAAGRRLRRAGGREPGIGTGTVGACSVQSTRPSCR